MYSAKLVGNQMDTVFGLYLPEYEVPAPEVQTNYKEIPYRDGAIDKTAPDGVVSFKDREWSLSFQKTGEDVSAYDVPALSASLMNAIHGKSGEIIFDDDPNYKWVGRVFVENVQCENNGLIIANISLITQPYKYGIEDIVVTDTIETEVDEYQGSIVSFEYSLGKELTKLLAHIEPIQDLHGYANPWPGGGGKNLFNKDGTDENNGYVSGKYLNYLGQEATPGSGTWFISEYIPIGSEVNYALSGLGSVSTPSICFYDSSKAFISGMSYQSRASFVGTTPSGAAYARLSAGPSSTEVNTIQLELGSTATAWQPYSNICPITGRTGLSVYVGPTQDQQDATTYAVDWTSEAGTVYGGTLDVVTGVLTVDKVYKAFDGTEDWGIVNGAYFMTVVGALNSVVNDSAISTHYLDNPNISTGNYQLGFRCYNRSASPYTGAAVLVRPEAPLTISLDDFKTWLATQNTNGTPFAVCYELATPITYQLTPKQIEALVGTNNMWSDAGEIEVAISVFDSVVLSNGRKPQSPKINVVSENGVALMFFVKGTKHIINLAAGEWSIPDLMLFEGDTDVYESGEGTITYTYKEASL